MLTNNIDNETSKIINDNNMLINGFYVRLSTRILNIFKKCNINFNKDILDSSMKSYLINTLIGTSNEVINSYKKLLYKYFDIINEYYHTHEKSKDKIKEVTKLFVKKLYTKDNPILNVSIGNGFINDINAKIYVYDNMFLNKEIEKRIKSDIIEVIDEIIRSNKEYLVICMKLILNYVLKGR